MLLFWIIVFNEERILIPGPMLLVRLLFKILFPDPPSMIIPAVAPDISMFEIEKE